MNEAHQQVLIAQHAIAGLNAWHSRLVEQLKQVADRVSELGALNERDGTLECSCLGHQMTASPRPVVPNGKLSTLEYDFITTWKEEETSILCLYLQSNGVITHDPEGNNKFYDFNGDYLRDNILAAMAGALLTSPVFLPRRDDPKQSDVHHT